MFDIPGLGVAGAGISTSLVTVLMVISLIVSIQRSPPLPGVTVFKFRLAIDLPLWTNVFRKGTPAATSALLEDSMFVAIGIVVGAFGGIALAAHYIVNSIVNIGNVISNGIGDATAIRVATHRGRGSKEDTRLAGYCGVALSTIATAIFAMAMLVAPAGLSSIFVGTDQPQNAEVISLASQLFLIAALSLVVEGVQVVAMRALRGLEDTFVPLIIAICGYWLVAFPLGLGFAYIGGLGVQGMWLGLTCGLASTAVAFLWRYNRLTRSFTRTPAKMSELHQDTP
jgi:MATE family multidrug resistance protein